LTDFLLVDHATIQPFACVVSGDTVGQMVDTGRELRGHGRVYVSKQALVGMAKAAGIVKGGKRFEELMAAADTFDAKDKIIAGYEEKLADADEKLRLARWQQNQDQQFKEWAQGRIEQLEQAVRDHGWQLLANVDVHEPVEV
jgi:hypothetical protein